MSDETDDGDGGVKTGIIFIAISALLAYHALNWASSRTIVFVWIGVEVPLVHFIVAATIVILVSILLIAIFILRNWQLYYQRMRSRWEHPRTSLNGLYRWVPFIQSPDKKYQNNLE